MSRPSTLVVVAGTATEVGKTWVGAELCRHLRGQGVAVAARKPAQSFEPDDPPEGTDAAVLGRASGEPPELVCPPHRWYPTAMAPPMAADALERPRLDLEVLVDEVTGSWPEPPADVGLVELAGGPWSPIAHDGDGIDLTAALAPDVVVLVADAGLGTLNAIRPAVVRLGARAPVAVVLNRYDADDELHRRNREWLADHDRVEAITRVDALAARVLGR